MNLLRHIEACNNADASIFLRFDVAGTPVGHVTEAMANSLSPWPDYFEFGDRRVSFRCGSATFSERNRIFSEILESLVERGVITHLHGEQYPATAGRRDEAVMLIDRAAAPYFGIRAFGQHVNGYVRDDGELKMWIGRRALDRRNFPGKLDNIAAGGLPCGIPLHENLLKECWEEAGIPAQLAATAVPTGTVTYNAVGMTGLKPDTLYCYDLELPGEFVPRCTDGEVEGFFLWSMDQLMDALRREGEFKLNCNLVIIDFLIRHGSIGPGHEEYLDLVTGLHPTLI